ncbi:MAG: DEAD/DEAH box helicase, partial [Planctomycetota bacterium]
MKFTDLDLKPLILDGLRDMEYVELTPVQEKTFPHVLSGRDIIARAETGSGKTAACAVPLVQMVDTSIK